MFTELNKRRQSGQSTLEYAILIIIIIGALISIQVYIKRGIQGRLKGAADDIGDQFSPGNTNVVHRVVTNSRTNDTFTDGVTSSVLTAEENVQEQMNMQVIEKTQEFWGGTAAVAP